MIFENDLEKGSKLHVEYITVTRNGKTYTQRYRKKTPEIEEPKTVLSTANRAAIKDRLFFSHYYNGEFYTSEGKKIYLPEEWKEYGKQLKKHDVLDAITDAHINLIHLADEQGLSEEDKKELKRDIYKNERKKFIDDILPKIQEREKKIEDWGKKNETRLKNIYKATFSKDGIIDTCNRQLAKINVETNYNDLQTHLNMVKARLGEEVLNKKISYEFNKETYTDTFGDFIKKIDQRIASKAVTPNKKIGLKDFKVLDLHSIPEDKMPGAKSWDDYYEKQLQYADQNLIK